ncbi:MAG: AsmA-like C-terminal region-containing protein, partial [Cyanothece sp. SIO1E1]|nr:AsmA-like C-terminal region-containing protein [Cyanothece sp. SIO1E1]
LSIMALTGIVDALTGEGLNFSELDVPFAYTDGEIQIADAKATGTSIGFTASGTVYTHADVLNIQGTVVPAYALNSMLGKIPLLGNIFAGTEDGGGVFAANFSVTGPIEDPQTTVNPLSALTPGILRNLFGAFKPEQQPHPLIAPEKPPVTVQ